MLLTTIALAKKNENCWRFIKSSGVSCGFKEGCLSLEMGSLSLPGHWFGASQVECCFFSINWFSVSLCLTGTIISSANTSQSQTGVMGQVWLGKAWPDLQKGGMRKPICRPETPIQGLFTFAFKIINHCTFIWTCMNFWHSE